MIRKVYIPLDVDERRALTKLAERERRDPRVQAAWIIRQYLEGLGLLPSASIANKTQQESTCDHPDR